ncbi:MAG: LD-carboxypeptidase [Xenococcaceae cyanobacterium]
MQFPILNSRFPTTSPSPLKPGDFLRVVAPSGALYDLEPFERGIEIWRSRGYRVETDTHWNAHYGYLAGTDNQRRQVLKQAWEDPECKAILCVRGGYGSVRLLENWHKGSSNRGKEEYYYINSPKWVVGFSDITALLWSLAQVGICGVHGPLLTTIANEPDWSIQRLFNCLEGLPLAPLKGKGWGGGQATGILFPGNLTVATHLLGTPIQPQLPGIILALEDVTEAPYRIDRMITQWRMSKALQGVKGIALGRFSRCTAPLGAHSWTVEEVLHERLSKLGIPIVSDLPFGHDGANAALPVGQLVELDAERGILSWPEFTKSSPSLDQA